MASLAHTSHSHSPSQWPWPATAHGATQPQDPHPAPHCCTSCCSSSEQLTLFYAMPQLQHSHATLLLLSCSPYTPLLLLSCSSFRTRTLAILLKIYGKMQTNKLMESRERMENGGNILWLSERANEKKREKESLKRCDHSWFTVSVSVSVLFALSLSLPPIFPLSLSLAWQSFLLIFERIPVSTTGAINKKWQSSPVGPK